jgi:hypothetical protein
MQFVKTFGSEGDENVQFQSSYGIAVDEDDNIVVADLSNHRLHIHYSMYYYTCRVEGPMSNKKGWNMRSLDSSSRKLEFDC